MRFWGALVLAENLYRALRLSPKCWSWDEVLGRTGFRGGPLQGFTPKPKCWSWDEGFGAHWFSRRTSSCSSGEKSLAMWKYSRISDGVLPLMMFATVVQHRCSRPLHIQRRSR